MGLSPLFTRKKLSDDSGIEKLKGAKLGSFASLALINLTSCWVRTINLKIVCQFYIGNFFNSLGSNLRRFFLEGVLRMNEVILLFQYKLSLNV